MNCRLCGDNNDSLTGYYHQSDTIGVIWLNDWYTVDFRLKSCDQNGNRTDGVGGPSCITGNIGETAYSLKCHSKGAMASLEIVFPENYELNKEKIQEYLCQECLDKVPQLLTFRKWKYEKEEAIPFCLVDFQTMELYSLQEGDVGYAIRDYWVEIERGKNTVSIDAYVLSA